MKDRPLIDLGMTGYDELFMNDAERREATLPKIYNIPLSEIDDFPNHPFQVRLDEDMDQLVESVKERGVITPITLRQKEDGRYEIVSGHRRRKACELAGLATVPAEIKELTRDEAIILMVESNLQRSTILPSEKAFSYKMRLEAMKRQQGERTDLTSVPPGQKLSTREIIAENAPDSNTQIQRYIRLTKLVPDLLAIVDEGRIALRPAVELSYLGKLEQQDLVAAIGLSLATPSHAQAIKLRTFSKEGKLSPAVIESIMCEEKPNQKEKINIKYPSANILVATKKDFEAKNRKKFCGRIATGDYDAVIIGHSQFEKIPMSLERQRAILQQQLDEVLDGISELKKNRGDNFSIKQLERTKKTVKQKLDKLNDQSRKDDVVTFEELGVDRIFIDEAHYYKNLAAFTKMRNVGGISQTEAMKSSDLYMKCRYLDELTGGRGVVFATGTPISNSMVEMYTMQKYLQYGALRRNDLLHFDAWASTFGETVTAIELSPEGYTLVGR